MIRVLLDCRMENWSGIGRYTRSMAGALAVHPDVDLVTVGPSGGLAPMGDVLSAKIARAHPFSLLGAVEFSRLVIHAKPDLVHCTHFPTPLPATVPLVATLHDVLPLVVPGLMPSRLKRWIYRRWIARAVRVTDRIMVPTNATGADVLRLFPSARTKLTIVPYAADDLLLGPIGPLRPGLEEAIAGPYLLAIGNTRPHKDLPTLIRALVGLAASGQDKVRLLLVGDEPPQYLGALLAGAPEEMRHLVTFVGKVSDPELRALYAGATAFVSPSQYEGFGLPALEAMALGAPVVAADSRAAKEVLGSAALFFPAGDVGALTTALDTLLADERARAQLVVSGQRRASEFSWRRTAEETVAVYREALWSANRGKPRGK